jgi:hypothetical protein
VAAVGVAARGVGQLLVERQGLEATASAPGVAATASSSVAQRCSAVLSAPSARAAAAAISSAPTCEAMRTSSGSTRRVISLRHDSKGSTQATAVYT